MQRFGTVIAAMTLVGGLVVSTVASVDAAPELPTTPSELCENHDLMLGEPPPPTSGPVPSVARFPSARGGFGVYVEPGLLASIEPAVEQYVTDLRIEGYDVVVQEFGGSAMALRSDLQARSANGLEGALLVGDLPVYDFSSGNPQDPSTYPHDIYFADLDGTYVDAVPLDVHVDGTGDVEPEIYVSRLSAAQVTELRGTSEAEVINAYFERVHAYRTGQTTYANRGAAFADADWVYTSWGQAVGLLHDEVIEVTDPADSTPAAYLALLAEDVESHIGAVHSGHDFLQFWGGRGYTDFEGEVTSGQLLAANPQPGFYNMFNCSAGDMTLPRFLLGAMAVASDRGMQGISSTKPGGIYGSLNYPYYAAMADGRSAGQAFHSFLQTQVGATDQPSEAGTISWMNGLVMQGDPTLVPAIMGDGPAALSGVAWHDIDGDGRQETGEPELADWTIWLDQDRDGEVDAWEPVTVTGPDGIYRFDDVIPTTYAVSALTPPGWSTSAPVEVDVVSGQVVEGVDIGNIRRPVAHLIAGNATPPPADRPIRDLLIEEGFEVSIVDDDGDLAALAPVDGDIVVISSSVVPSKVGETLADVAAPVLTWEGYLFDDMAMSASGETGRTYRSHSIVDPLHPLAAGASGNARVYNNEHKLSYGMPGPDADVVASVPGRPEQATVFAYDRGDTLVDGTAAPGRRVGLFPDYAGAGDLTEQGTEMVRAAVRWVQTGPPANDDFADRFAVGAGEYSGTVENASLEPGEPTPSVAPDAAEASVWWSWTAPSDGWAFVDTFGSRFDTVLGAWTGSQLASLTEIASGDDVGDTGESSVSFEVEAGIEYELAVYRYGNASASNDVSLSIGHSPAPANDDFADRVLVADGVHTGSLAGATFEAGEQHPLNVSDPVASAWWSWTAPADGRAQIMPTMSSSGSAGTAIWTGDDIGGLAEVGSAADGEVINFEAEEGITYHLAFYSSFPLRGDIEFTIDFTVPPPNDEFADRIAIGLGSHTGSNIDATLEDGEVLPQAGDPRASVWWTWTASRAGTIEVDTFGSDFDTVLAAWDGDDVSTLTEIASNDDFGGYEFGLQSIIRFEVDAGQTVQLGVYGYYFDEGTIQLNVRYDERRAVLVAGDDKPPRADRAIRDLMEDQGFVVDVVDDDSDLTALDLSGVELLVVTSSVNTSKVGDVFANVDVPVLVWEGYLFDEFGLARRGRETGRLHTDVIVVDDHPASGGLDGRVIVYGNDHRFSTAEVAAGAQVIAHEPGRPRSAVMFAYEAGIPLFDGTPAPARRIGLFPDYLGAGDLTAAGNLLVTSAIDWLTETS